MEIIQEIGSYAGFAAVIGLAILSALYFSQARDVKRLREWAGRAPERAAEIEAGGRAAAGVPVAARPQPQVPKPAPQHAATAPAAAAAASAGAAPASATAPASSADGDEENEEATEAVPVGASEGATVNGAESAEDAEADEEAAEDERPAAAPAAATAAGAVASAAGTAERPGAATAGTAVAGGQGTGDTGTGAKVLPERRPAPPVRPRPTIPPTRTIPPRAGQTSVLSSQTATRPPARRGGGWPAPRYIALIVAGVVILGLGGTVGVLQLTKEDEEPPTRQAETDVADPTRAPDAPESTPAINPADVKVAVLNATTTTGLAARIGSRLQSAGFNTGNLTNAAEQSRTESVVMFKPGKNDEARTVARRLDIGSIEPIDAQTEPLVGDAIVVVVLGADKAQQ